MTGGDGPGADPTAVFAAERPRLFGLAYRLLGSAHDAEDAVQDAWPRWAGTDTAAVASPAAWLTTTVTRLCLNRLASARARRETYPGPWLPEPVPTADVPGPDDAAESRDSVSLALLAVLETLTPAERAVWVLREAFGHPHREIAGIVGVTEANARQLHARARRHLAARPHRPVAQPDRAAWVRLVEGFLAAAREGDVAALEALLAADVTAWADGGGRVTAARVPLRGAPRVAVYLARTLGRPAPERRGTLEEVNGRPVLLGWVDGALVGVLDVEFADGLVTAVRLLVNPEKLAYLTTRVSRPGPPPGQP